MSFHSYGVVALVIPWNVPMHIPGATRAPALATGNTVIVKPSELAAFSSIRFGELALEAGFPPGVVNVVPAGIADSEHLVRHPGVDKIHFTGSTATVLKILPGTMDNLTPVGMELGGRSARLVFADCDIDAAVRDAASGALSLSGQGCLLGTRLLVEAPIYDEFAARFARVLEATSIGDPPAEATQMGPVVTEASCNRILGMIETARRSGGSRLVTGGKRVGGDLVRGYFVQPTLFADVDNRSALAQTEVFGPVLAMTPVHRAGRRDPHGELHAVRSRCLRPYREPEARPRRGERTGSRERVDQRLLLRRNHSLRRSQEKCLRTNGLTQGSGRVLTD